MDGAQRLAIRTGSNFIEGASLDFNFAHGKYLNKGTILSEADLASYHTRSSSALATQADGSYKVYGIDTPRITHSGYQSEPAAVGLLDPFNAGSYDTANANPTITSRPGQYLGLFNNAITVSSNGSLAACAGYSVPDCLSGDQHVIRGVFEKGTSTASRLLIFGNNMGTSHFASIFTDDFVSTKIFNNSWGVISEANYIDLGGDFFELRCKFTADRDYSGVRIFAGPHSTVVDDNVGVLGIDVKLSDIFTTPTNGTRSADRLRLLSVENNLNFTEGALFWKGQVLNQNADYPRLALLGQGWQNGIQFLINKDNNDVNIALRSDNIGGPSTSLELSESDITMGVTWRSDGTARLKINDDLATNATNYIPPLTVPNLFISTSTVSMETSNSIVGRFAGFSTSLTDNEFDQVFEKVSA